MQVSLARGASRWAFFERRPRSVPPTEHSIVIALDGTFLKLLRAKAYSAQDAPDLRLAKAHAVHAFDDSAHTLECP